MSKLSHSDELLSVSVQDRKILLFMASFHALPLLGGVGSEIWVPSTQSFYTRDPPCWSLCAHFLVWSSKIRKSNENCGTCLTDETVALRIFGSTFRQKRPYVICKQLNTWTLLHQSSLIQRYLLYCSQFETFLEFISQLLAITVICALVWKTGAIIKWAQSREVVVGIWQLFSDEETFLRRMLFGDHSFCHII